MAANARNLREWLHDFVQQDGFLSRYPYYTAVLASLEVVEDPGIESMAVSIRGPLGATPKHYLHVNVDRVSRTPEYLRGLLLHEVHHIVLGHASHPRYLGREHRDLMEIAMEVSANEYIEEPLPSPILWRHFETFGFRPGQSTLERYELLCAARAEAAEPLPAPGTSQVDSHMEMPRERSGTACQATEDLVRDAFDRASQELEERRPSDARATRIAGRDPDDVLLMLAPGEPPDVDWTDALAMFVARARAPLHTFRRPSRRFPDRPFEVPGRAYQYRPSLRPNVLVALDTSLSMGERELHDMARNLRPIAEHANVIVAECDVEIARVYPFAGRIESLRGRGGTDLRPVFDPRFLRARRIDGVVYFTDGEGPYPEEPPIVPVLWVLTKPRAFECPWGARARLRRT